MKNKGRADWFLRFVKGMFIGSGFILPGVSGGALAAVFGIYERLISFLANLKKDFKKNLLFFIPVGLGMAAGVFVLAFPIDYLLKSAQVYVMWFFIGCILGTLPALFKQASKKGWKYWHVGLLWLSVPEPTCCSGHWKVQEPLRFPRAFSPGCLQAR
jgi:putative membrane protein